MAIISEIGQYLNLHQRGEKQGEEAEMWKMEGQSSPERRVGREKAAKDITEL